MTSMTDNRTTELLREGLIEHGIGWRTGLKGVTFVGDWCFVEYDNGKLAATCEPVLTPEQAIAATLGGGECEPTEEYACSVCGQDLVACDVSVGPNGGAIELDPPILFNFCPNCGKRIRKAVKR